MIKQRKNIGENMICPICKAKLIKYEKNYQCLNHHSFDISKTGYTNLTLNSKNSGDNKEMIHARHLIMEEGCFEQVAQKIIEILKNLKVQSLLDAGSGEGYYTRQIANSLNISTYGIDISKEACLLASKLNKNTKYFVASIYNIPFDDNEIEAIINVFAPHCAEEFLRVAQKYLLIVVPGKKHLIELKEKLYHDVYLHEEANFAFKGFELLTKEHVTYQKEVVNVNALIKMTPYFYKTKNPILNLEKLLITFAFDILVYKKQF